MAVSRISHCQVGGVTRGRWKIRGDLKLRGIKSSPVKCVLKHILVSTEMGKELYRVIKRKNSLALINGYLVDRTVSW